MSTGTVKWFNRSEGVGYIANDEGNEDIFVHFAAFNFKGHKSLGKGDRVSFGIEDDLINGDFHATNVEKL